MNHEEHIKELAKKFLEVVPHGRYFELKELRKYIWEKTKGFTFSEEEFYEVTAYLLNNSYLRPDIVDPRYQVISSDIVDDKYNILGIQTIREVFRPLY